MWLMMQQNHPDDYVIATGESHSVEEFLSLATEIAGLGDWHDFVEIDKAFLRPTDIEDLVGDPSKAQKELGWKPKINFKDLVKMMVEHDLDYFRHSV
jgi:GDPmannose 4,6-dehydratase